MGVASVRERIENARRVMFARFVDPKFGTIYDYAPLSAATAVDLPTPKDCQERKPNALAWWCPIENGGFFGGLYLSALSDGFRRFRAGENEARRIAGGLVRLAEVGAKSTPGFIARGISTDGSTHFPASSSDQTYPWFYGMYSYLTSGIVKPGSKERASLVSLVEDVASALERNEWRMPCDAGPGFGNFGDWAGAFSASRTTLTGAEPHFDAASRLLFVHLALHRLTGRKRWLDLYRQRRDEKPEGSAAKSRLEICGNGVEYAPPGTPAGYPDHPPLWTSASSQGALRALFEMEPDSHARSLYRRGLDANATRAAAYISRYRSFDNSEDKLTFRHDWRFLNDIWRPQPTIQDAVKLATEQVRLWHKQSPRKVYESDFVRDPLFAAWIVALSGNRRIIDQARADIDGALTHYQWERMHTSHFFMAECCFYSL